MSGGLGLRREDLEWAADAALAAHREAVAEAIGETPETVERIQRAVEDVNAEDVALVAGIPKERVLRVFRLADVVTTTGEEVDDDDVKEWEVGAVFAALQLLAAEQDD